MELFIIIEAFLLLRGKEGTSVRLEMVKKGFRDPCSVLLVFRVFNTHQKNNHFILETLGLKSTCPFHPQLPNSTKEEDWSREDSPCSKTQTLRVAADPGCLWHSIGGSKQVPKALEDFMLYAILGSFAIANNRACKLHKPWGFIE